jgi:hypothetical protein
MGENRAFEDNPILEALRDEPGKVDSGVDTNRSEGYPRINSRAKVVFGKLPELVNGREYAFLSSFEFSMLLLTFGTISLNHGFGDSSSENQAAVVELTSLVRLCTSHSVGSSANRMVFSSISRIPYLGNAHQPRGGFVQGPLAVPRYFYPILQPQCRGSRPWSDLMLVPVLRKIAEIGNATYGM